jgi:hypothetical protein
LHKASLLRTIAITTNGFAYQAEAIIRLIADGASYTHCPVVIRDRATGRSSALKLKNIAQVTKTVFLLAATVGVFRKYRPFSRSLRTSSN